MARRMAVNIGRTSAGFSAFDTVANRFHAKKAVSTPARPGSRATTGIAELDTRHGITPSDSACRVNALAARVHPVVRRKRVRRVALATGQSVAVREVTWPVPETALTRGKPCARAGALTRVPVDRRFVVRHRVFEGLACLSGRGRPGNGSRAPGVFETAVAECGAPVG